MAGEGTCHGEGRPGAGILPAGWGPRLRMGAAVLVLACLRGCGWPCLDAPEDTPRIVWTALREAKALVDPVGLGDGLEAGFQKVAKEAPTSPDGWREGHGRGVRAFGDALAPALGFLPAYALECPVNLPDSYELVVLRLDRVRRERPDVGRRLDRGIADLEADLRRTFSRPRREYGCGYAVHMEFQQQVMTLRAKELEADARILGADPDVRRRALRALGILMQARHRVEAILRPLEPGPGQEGLGR